MTPEILSTHDLPAAQQLEAWRASFSAVFDLEQPQDTRLGFRAESRHWALDGLGIGKVSAPSLRAVRSRALVRSNPVDHWVLTVGQRDTGIRTPHDSVAVPAGTPFLISLGTDVSSERVADERLHIYLPRDNFAEIATQLDAARGLPLDTGLGRLLGDFLRNLACKLPNLTQEDVPHVTAAVRAMVGACVAPSADRIIQASRQIDAMRLDKIRRIVRQNIESPELDGGMICGALGMSRTQLYRLLNGEGGVAHYIRRLRLEACHDRLSDAANPATVGQIAARLGFDDPSQFSRSFRREFGMTPREVRAAALAGTGPASSPADLEGMRPLRAFLQGL